VSECQSKEGGDEPVKKSSRRGSILVVQLGKKKPILAEDSKLLKVEV